VRPKRIAKLSSLGSRPTLGPLESQVMEVIWKQGEVTIRDVYDFIRQQRDLAYTTVMTVVHNLHRKGILKQRLDGKTHYYMAVQSRSQFVESKVGELLDALLEDFTEPALAHLINRLSKTDNEKLIALEHLLAERRAQAKRENDV